MTKTDTEFRIGRIVNRTDSYYTALTKTCFIEQLQEIPIKKIKENKTLNI